MRIYTRGAKKGMTGSETCLEELMLRVLGEFIQEGYMARIANDLYDGGDVVPDALGNWDRILAKLSHNYLSLCAPKTIICPRSTVVLGWIRCEDKV